MRVSKFFAAIMVSVSLFLSVYAQNGDRLPPIPYKEYKLKNGLTVILHPDKSTPIIGVNVWYHVGSKNEAPGRTGFAHLFEHIDVPGVKELCGRLAWRR
jgi:predicted Zn-dependent peptidase